MFYSTRGVSRASMKQLREQWTETATDNLKQALTRDAITTQYNFLMKKNLASDEMELQVENNENVKYN